MTTRLSLMKTPCPICGDDLTFAYSPRMEESDGSLFYGIGEIELIDVCACDSAKEAMRMLKAWPLGDLSA